MERRCVVGRQIFAVSLQFSKGCSMSLYCVGSPILWSIPIDWYNMVPSLQCFNPNFLKLSKIAGQRFLTFFPAPTLAFFVPRTFFILFFFSLRCFLAVLDTSNRPCYGTNRKQSLETILQLITMFTKCSKCLICTIN